MAAPATWRSCPEAALQAALDAGALPAGGKPAAVCGTDVRLVLAGCAAFEEAPDRPAFLATVRAGLRQQCGAGVIHATRDHLRGTTMHMRVTFLREPHAQQAKHALADAGCLSFGLGGARVQLPVQLVAGVKPVGYRVLIAHYPTGAAMLHSDFWQVLLRLSGYAAAASACTATFMPAHGGGDPACLDSSRLIAYAPAPAADPSFSQLPRVLRFDGGTSWVALSVADQDTAAADGGGALPRPPPGGHGAVPPTSPGPSARAPTGPMLHHPPGIARRGPVVPGAARTSTVPPVPAPCEPTPPGVAPPRAAPTPVAAQHAARGPTVPLPASGPARTPAAPAASRPAAPAPLAHAQRQSVVFGPHAAVACGGGCGPADMDEDQPVVAADTAMDTVGAEAGPDPLPQPVQVGRRRPRTASPDARPGRLPPPPPLPPPPAQPAPDPPAGRALMNADLSAALFSWAEDHASEATSADVRSAISLLHSESPDLWSLHGVVALTPPRGAIPPFLAALGRLNPNAAAAAFAAQHGYDTQPADGGGSCPGEAGRDGPWRVAGRGRGWASGPAPTRLPPLPRPSRVRGGAACQPRQPSSQPPTPPASNQRGALRALAGLRLPPRTPPRRSPPVAAAPTSSVRRTRLAGRRGGPSLAPTRPTMPPVVQPAGAGHPWRPMSRPPPRRSTSSAKTWAA